MGKGSSRIDFIGNYFNECNKHLQESQKQKSPPIGRLYLKVVFLDHWPLTFDFSGYRHNQPGLFSSGISELKTGGAKKTQGIRLDYLDLGMSDFQSLPL